MHWIQLFLGVCVIISPWALGMEGALIVWTNATFGAIIILTSAWSIFVKK